MRASHHYPVVVIVIAVILGIVIVVTLLPTQPQTAAGRASSPPKILPPQVTLQAPPSDRSFIRDAYRVLLNRSPTCNETARALQEMSTRATRRVVFKFLEETPEHYQIMARYDRLDDYFTQYYVPTLTTVLLARSPHENEPAAWLNALLDGTSTWQVFLDFEESPEYQGNRTTDQCNATSVPSFHGPQ